MPVVFLVLNLVVNFWIPEADSSKYSFLQSKDKETEGEKKKKKHSLLESYVRGIKECIDPTIGMQAFPPCRQGYVIVRVLTVALTLCSCLVLLPGLVFILVILLQLNKIRLVIPQIIAVELFNDDSYAAWIFSTYSLGGVIGTCKAFIFAFLCGRWVEGAELTPLSPNK